MRRFSPGRGSLWAAVVPVAAALAVSVTQGSAAGGAERLAQEASGAETVSVWDGVYSDSQAERGSTVYRYVCTECHHGELQGDPGMGAPALAGEAFFTNWEGLTAEALFDKIFRTMPYEDPETLNALDAVDLVAYILQFNEFPSGEGELAPDPGRMGRIVIEQTNPRSQE